jgi:hypothetical protein
MSHAYANVAALIAPSPKTDTSQYVRVAANPFKLALMG